MFQVFVQDNDVYYRRNIYGEEGEFRVTTTGKPDEIFNGVPDWVFEGKYHLNCDFFKTINALNVKDKEIEIIQLFNKNNNSIHKSNLKVSNNWHAHMYMYISS
jgi:hypothetical protein